MTTTEFIQFLMERFHIETDFCDFCFIQIRYFPLFYAFFGLIAFQYFSVFFNIFHFFIGILMGFF